MANFIGLVYATLKKEGIDTSKMDNAQAIAKYNELQKKSGGKAGEKEGTPAENREMEKQGYTYKKQTADGSKIINKYNDGGKSHIIAKVNEDEYIVGYDYNEETGKPKKIQKFGSMGDAEESFRKGNPRARLTEQNLGKPRHPFLIKAQN